MHGTCSSHAVRVVDSYVAHSQYFTDERAWDAFIDRRARAGLIAVNSARHVGEQLIQRNRNKTAFLRRSNASVGRSANMPFLGLASTASSAWFI
jgi:hypothetical protein